MAVGAGHARLVHAALAVGAVLEDLVELLAVGVVEAGAQVVGDELVEQGRAGHGVLDQPGAARVAGGALVDLGVRAGERPVRGGQRRLAALARGGAPACALGVRAAGAVAGLAAHVRLGPGGGVAVVLVVVALAVGGGVALAAHQVPVLVAPAPVQVVARGDRAVGVQREPGLARGIPGDREGLQASALLRQQHLLQRPDAEDVADRERLRAAVGPLRGDHEVAAAAVEARRRRTLAEVDFAGAGLAEVAEHGLRRRRLHRMAVLRFGPGVRLVGVAGEAVAVGDVVGPRPRLRGGRERGRRHQDAGEEQGGQAHALRAWPCAGRGWPRT